MLYRVQDGRIQAQAIEYSVAYHCNLRCSACSHMSPFIGKQFPPLDGFIRDLEALAPVLRTKDIRLLGGEPLLNPQVVDFLRAAKASGIAETIMLTTNGLLLHSQPDAFWENVDFIWLSLYPGRSPPEKALEHIRAKATEFGVRLDEDPTSHFRATYVTEPHPKDFVTDMIFKTCGSAHRYHCHMLFEGKLFKCAVPPFLPEFLEQMGKDGYDPAADAFDIHSAGNLFEELKAWLFTPVTLEACRWCVGYVGKREEHHQLEKAVLANPAAESRTRTSHLDRRLFVQESLKYYGRRVAERVTGEPRW